MFGTIVNAAAIVAGGTVGVLVKKGIPSHLEEALHRAMGLAVIVIGMNGVITNMVTANGERFLPRENCCWCSAWFLAYWWGRFFALRKASMACPKRWRKSCI